MEDIKQEIRDLRQMLTKEEDVRRCGCCRSTGHATGACKTHYCYACGQLGLIARSCPGKDNGQPPARKWQKGKMNDDDVEVIDFNLEEFVEKYEKAKAVDLNDKRQQEDWMSKYFAKVHDDEPEPMMRSSWSFIPSKGKVMPSEGSIKRCKTMKGVRIEESSSSEEERGEDEQEDPTLISSVMGKEA
uniref:CCHC-type domain-containing protein n=1 Tax=Romanomermis culicivorax TaxID=13658 RepID=A0A915K074_ROMCU